MLHIKHQLDFTACKILRKHRNLHVGLTVRLPACIFIAWKRTITLINIRCFGITFACTQANAGKVTVHLISTTSLISTGHWTILLHIKHQHRLHCMQNPRLRRKHCNLHIGLKVRLPACIFVAWKRTITLMNIGCFGATFTSTQANAG